MIVSEWPYRVRMGIIFGSLKVLVARCLEYITLPAWVFQSEVAMV